MDGVRQRYRLLVEYHGAPYRGWQSQADGRGVQDAVERALVRLKSEAGRLHCAGRTDAGVHALGQVVHVDLAKEWRHDRLRDALNFHLREADERVAILAAEAAPPGFDARLSAIQRHYRYRILTRRAPAAALHAQVWQVAKPLDPDRMKAAAATILGKHDFTTFRAASCQAKSPIRTLERLAVFAAGDEIHVEASARSFLQHQVRSMVGSLARIGSGTWPVERMREILDAADRARCGPVAPPDGLYFTRVEYPEPAVTP